MEILDRLYLSLAHFLRFSVLSSVSEALFIAVRSLLSFVRFSVLSGFSEALFTALRSLLSFLRFSVLSGVLRLYLQL